jgi:tRNA dimethylallyltransferase
VPLWFNMVLSFDYNQYLTLEPYNFLTILGPTATGKTTLAAHLAYHLNGEVISADSRQVYRGMTIGTGKDMADYWVDGKQIPVHLTDIVDAGTQYNVFEYQRDFQKVLHDLRQRDKFPVLCGGSGLYIEAVLRNYTLIQVPVNEDLRSLLAGKSLDELTEILKSYTSKLHNITDIVNEKRAIRAIEIADYYRNLKTDGRELSERRDLRELSDRWTENGERGTETGNRLPITDYRSPITDHRSPITDYQLPDTPGLKPLIVGIKYELETRRERITQRLHQRLNEGMVEEVKSLLDEGIPPEGLIYYGLEYKYITLYLTGAMTYPEMVEKLNISIHQFAKRQMTWFRRMERQGTIIHWLDGLMPMEEKINTVLKLLKK